MMKSWGSMHRQNEDKKQPEFPDSTCLTLTKKLNHIFSVVKVKTCRLTKSAGSTFLAGEI